MDADRLNLALIVAVVAGTMIASVIIRRRRPVIDQTKPSRMAMALWLFGPLVADAAAIGLLIGAPSLSVWIPAWLIIGGHCGSTWWLLSRRMNARASA